ncbi:MAG: YdbH domain-containing protein [Gammaproteobacteria bacterium]|nr:YdbH domain-containing protein [Gammaproteobacteria bacterium]MBU1979427.1 YdbH domain-containing protein [Gammaproteobacteria bacterium]
MKSSLPWAKAVRAMILLAFFSSGVEAGQITLSIDDISSPAFHAKAISATLDGPDFSRLEARIGELSLRERTWRKVRLTCVKTQWNNGEIRCDQGELDLGEKLPVRFVYQQQSKTLALTLDFPQGETWQLGAQWGKPGWKVRVEARNGQVMRLAGFLPQGGIRPTAGTWSGSISLDGSRTELGSVIADAVFKDIAFADASGLHAGEKIGGGVRCDVSRRKDGWLWRGEVDWKSGEVFWQPVYFADGGHRFVGQGSLEAGLLRVNQGNLRLAGVGEAQLSGAWDMAGRGLTDFDLKAAGLDLTGLYKVLIKPFLEKTAFAKLKSKGEADLAWRYRDGVTTEFDLSLRAAEFIDEDQRFALHGMNARIPWSNTEERQAEFGFQSGEVLHLALGKTRVPLTMKGWQFSTSDFSIPLLDGRINVDGFTASRIDGVWQWHFSGGLAPVSMERFSEALKLPLMHGTLSGIIPVVSYAGGNLKVDGALLFKVFDGTVVVKDLSLLEPFGRVPRLSATLDMRNLDLDLLTSAFSFGNMQGRIDVAVAGLELSSWRPVKFDAKVASSPGNYPKKISQKAVQSISSLGGAGAAAAIQRSFLSFFEQFGYDRIGLSCVLRNGVCLMDGVEPAPHGYVIVKGGGIPAISVIGYNREVSWDELLERLKRVTQKNVKPVIQ